MTEKVEKGKLLALTAEIVASHVGNNRVDSAELPQIIQQVFSSLSSVDGAPARPERPQPAVPIKKSVTPDFIICLEDGKKFKSLKRHLRTHYDMSPEEYREKWGLQSDYPMVAPNYAAARSELAKKMGLGQQRKRGK